jgi:hypothetical protein
MLKISLFVWPKAKHLRQLTILLLTVLLTTSSESMAKTRKTVRQYGNPVAAGPEDPEAYARRIARETWPGRALCDFGGYRIIPCDTSGRF